MANKKRNNTCKPETKGRTGSNNQRSSKGYNTESVDKRGYNPKAKGSNDPSWYASDSALLRDSASIPFSWAVGSPINFNIDGFKNWSVPGIMTYSIAPSFGFCNDGNQALNVAATSVYSFVRHANSGHSNYDSPDLMIYLLAMTQVYSYINFLQRVYGSASLFAQKNRYLPEAIIESQGVSYDSIYNNLANLRYGINVLINKCASLAVPNDMPLFLRQAFLYQNIYCEGESVKDQLYMYVPEGFYRFKWDATSAGMLEYVPLIPSDGHKLTVDELLKYGNDMLSVIIKDEDMNIMSGDILKAYGGNIIKLTSLSEEYPLVPLYNKEVLEQMKNATPIHTANYINRNVVQSADKSHLIFEPIWKVSTDNPLGAGPSYQYAMLPAYYGNQILTTAVSEADSVVVMENTRLMTPVSKEGFTSTIDQTISGKRIICGSEIVTGVQYWYYRFDDNMNATLSTGRIVTGYPVEVSSSATGAANIGAIAKVGHFKYHPRMMLFIGENIATDSYTVKYSEIYFDIDNYAILDPQTIGKMHETALLSMLHVNSIAKIN